ncbi:helix-turn-helix domain-containing protein [Aggregatibacter actinomycetemcomitans]|uniref:helix-turn-helix domain-containing protein n=1 Tax=Aggregatibacter actinomycetemcomitans TaxID=714 RepID=UPI00023FEED9|nr:helix-turn-helix domain-containing protein [Aggregatibacter actinomycetemcomitans]EHK89920.1 transposase [Aggregatibacter actinomycetemcomitans RhAA1]EHK90130.1 transposase [Aggregatibacter actinomycetemcomitans RhAA1]EHK90303.1 transposase [Aggregatibacter actinomycetemcomitans RhAA1]EHK90315.1 transposase [Aggregatibacter actinomycetemcomitans RhAA1]EHK90358.1 transposase [Aggregatibacter actinomycetemcomitans RhAA1]
MGKHYSIEFKHHIVKLVLEEHWGIREVAQHFHIAAHSSVVVRLQRFEKYGINGLHRQPATARKVKMPKRKETPLCDNPQNIKALLKELEYLRAENAILKKFKEPDEQKARQKKGTSSTR